MKKRKFFQKIILSIAAICFITMFQPQTVKAVTVDTSRWYGYSFWLLSDWSLMYIKDSDAGGNMQLVPWIIKPGGGVFSEIRNENKSIVYGDFENYTPYWKVVATEIPGYTFTGIRENTPRGDFAMYSYRWGNPYELYVDAGMWYGDWMNHSDSWNNTYRLRENGTWSTIYASYTPNHYQYTLNNGKTKLLDCTYNDPIQNISVPSASNTVYFNAGTNHKGQAATCNTSQLTVNHTFNGYYDWLGTQHFNGLGQSTQETYQWPNDVDLAASWTYNEITLPTPTLTGYRFDGWYSGETFVGWGGSQYTPTADVTLTAKWTDTTDPTVSISGTPTTWKNENGVITINAVDNESGLYQIDLYRKDSGGYTKIKTWTENSGVYNKTYTYTETGENQYQYKVVVTDRSGNKTTKESNVIQIDRTAPVSSGTVINALGELDSPVAKSRNADGSINSESYGLYINVNASDENGSKTVSNIKNAYVKVYQRGNPSNVKYYDINETAKNTITAARNGKETDVLTATSLNNLSTINKKSYEKDIIIDVTKDFNGVLDLAYEVHIIDYAGNDAFYRYNNLKGSSDREARIYATINCLTKDENLSNPIAFKGGYKGVLTITTTGWVDKVNIKWPEEIYIGRAEDESLGQPIMNYDALVYKTPGSNATIDANGITLNAKNTITSPDTHETRFTRVYQFYFWIPFYIERANGIEEATGYVVDLETIRPYAYPQKNNGIAKLSVPFTIGDGNIFKRFRSSILY